MRPLSLTLKHFIGIRSGLGRDELTLDLDAITDGAQLVALVGPNGTGKTTVLDNLHPYLIQPSRASSYSPGSFSYYDHTYGPEAGKDLVWEHDGKLYRSALIFKQTAKTKKTEAYLQERDGDGWTPVTLPDNTVSDGKVETYNRCVEHVLGSPEMFFTAAFSSQGRKSLSSYSNGDIKGLLSELLGLEHIRELGGKAKDVTKGIVLHLDAMRGDLARIQEQEEHLEASALELTEAEAELSTQAEAKQRARVAVGQASRNLSEVQADANANTETEIRRQELTARLAGAKQRATTNQRNAEQDIAAEQQRRQTSEQGIQQDVAALERQQTAAKEQIERNRTLIGRRDEMERAKAALPRLQTAEQEATAALESARDDDQRRVDIKAEADRAEHAVTTATQAIAVARTQIERNRALQDRRPELDSAAERFVELQGAEQAAINALNTARSDEQRRADLQSQIDRIADSLGGIKREGEQLAAQCKSLSDRSALTGEVPCQGTDLQGRCKLMAEAVSAKEQIPAVEQDTETKRNEYRQQHASMEKLRAQMADLGDTSKTVTQYEESLENVRRQIRETEQVIALKDSIAQAEEAIATATADIQTKEQEVREYAGRLEHLRAQLNDLGDTREAVHQRETGLEEARRQVRSSEQTASLEQSIAQAEEAITAAETQITEIGESIAAKSQALTDLVADSEQRIATIRDRQSSAVQEIAQELSRTEQELALLPPPSDTSALEQAQQALEVAERSLTQAEQAVTALNTRIGTLNERGRGLAKALEGAANLKAKAHRLEDEIAHWTALSKAFGNDGIVALTIDDAGPTLAALTNDLLLSCYGSRFTIAVRTQEENAKGDMKETFDIRVFDSERDDEKSVRDMSGGEKIWINEALTRAMALYQAQASGQQYGCLFADESDGALDPERKQQFMHMKREVLRLGGYRQEFFISHSPELWEMADATINLEEFRA